MISLALALMIAIQGGAAQSVDVRGLYAAILVDLNVPVSPLVVQEQSLSMARPSPAEWEWFGSDSNELRKKVDISDAPIQALLLQDFSANTRLVPRSEAEELFRPTPGETLDHQWAAFRERFGARAYEGFSRPIVTDDGLDALVWYSHACGSCGQAGYAWLHRQTTTSPWTVKKRLPKVVS